MLSNTYFIAYVHKWPKIGDSHLHGGYLGVGDGALFGHSGDLCEEFVRRNMLFREEILSCKVEDQWDQLQTCRYDPQTRGGVCRYTKTVGVRRSTASMRSGSETHSVEVSVARVSLKSKMILKNVYSPTQSRSITLQD